jgi:hypothetical protein
VLLLGSAPYYLNFIFVDGPIQLLQKEKEKVVNTLMNN